MSRSRGWCFTLNNYSEDDELLVYDLAHRCDYICVGRERGASGTPHFQGYIYWSTLKSLSQMCEEIHGAHWEPQRGTPAQASEYCKKEGDYFEHGTLPLQRQERGGMEKERWELALSAYKAGNYEAVPPDILIRYGKGLDFAVSKLVKYDLSDTEEKMEWYYGASGTGKSRRARDENPGAYLKMCNKWWDGYSGEDVVIIEDFDKSHSVLCHHMKIWADRYSFPAEIKGAKMDIRPKKIIVTSNYHPRDIWIESADLDPIMRRFRITHFNSLFVNN